MIVAFRQEQEYVPTIKEVPPMSQKLTKILAKFKNAVMTLGLHGVAGGHVPIMDLGHIDSSVHDENSFKFLHVHKRVLIVKTAEPFRIDALK